MYFKHFQSIISCPNKHKSAQQQTLPGKLRQAKLSILVILCPASGMAEKYPIKTKLCYDNMYCHICLTVSPPNTDYFEKKTWTQQKILQQNMAAIPIVLVFSCQHRQKIRRNSCVVRTNRRFCNCAELPGTSWTSFCSCAHCPPSKRVNTNEELAVVFVDPSPATTHPVANPTPMGPLRDLFVDFKSICCEIVFRICSVYIHIFMMYVHMSSF